MAWYNTDEVTNGGNDNGYSAAYTEVKGSSSGGPFTGPCTDAAGNGAAFAMSHEVDGVGAYDSSKTHTLAWATGGEGASVALIEAFGGNAEGTEALTICANLCSAKLNWGALTADNMPFTYTASGNVLTSTDAGAVT
jgi:hypothetical protein